MQYTVIKETAPYTYGYAAVTLQLALPVFTAHITGKNIDSTEHCQSVCAFSHTPHPSLFNKFITIYTSCRQ